MRFFHKALVSNPVVLSSGRGIRWESIGGDEGVVSLNQEDVIKELKDAEGARRGGVREVTQQEYEELKKKAGPQSLPSPRLGDPWREPNPPTIIRQGLEDVVGGGRQPQPRINTPPEPPPKDMTPHIKPPLSFGSAGATNRPKATKAPPKPK
jgi:hypothetical protein